MTIVTNTYLTYSAKGIREDLTDVIYNISPEDCPFMSNAGRISVKQTLHEWQTDSLATAVSTNAQLEADDLASFTAATASSRIGNYCQIARKDVLVGGTLEVVNKAGRDSEIAYQLAKKSAELKRDIETGLLANQPAVAGAAATARQTGAVLAFVKTNVDKDAAGVNPVWTTTPTVARTDSGATRAFTETILKNVIQLQWAQGGKCDTVMVGGTQKQTMSTFAGIATKTWYTTASKTASIIGAADVYVSDFGSFSIVPNRFGRNRDAHVLDFDLIKIGYLRPFKTIPLAKTGDAEKRMILVEYVLQLSQEAGLGLAADLT